MKGCKGEEYIREDFLKRSGKANKDNSQCINGTKGIYNKPSCKEAKQWDGWGTGLKPAHEPLCLARKPITESTIAKNVLKYGTGGINIDKCRVGYNNNADKEQYNKSFESLKDAKKRLEGPVTKSIFSSGFYNKEVNSSQSQSGRFPANLILSWDEDEYQLKDNISKEDSKKLKDWLDANT